MREPQFPDQHVRPKEVINALFQLATIPLQPQLSEALRDHVQPVAAKVGRFIVEIGNNSGGQGMVGGW